ncbi:unnamed protein product [Paramecium pentaurelia]|uniref:Uncharacterized protein n=1 Tax=Paramecium pentaurelia TaxID=43138 RepID=A0A8S1SJN2_9CILI|nr:unnamed protein product [Paramecium pentaurelia]
MDTLFSMFDSFIRSNLSYYPMNQQGYIMECWEQFLSLLQTQPLDYGKIYSLINQMHEIDKYERQSSTQRQAAKNLTTALSPRIISSQQKNSNNLLQKFSQLDNATSPKIQLSNLTSQQSLVNKQKVKLYTEDFNRHLLLSKIKELLFNQSVSTDKLYAMARIQQHSSSKSPLKYAPTKTRGNNHSAEHYRA